MLLEIIRITEVNDLPRQKKITKKNLVKKPACPFNKLNVDSVIHYPTR